jgi:hypothetical protein
MKSYPSISKEIRNDIPIFAFAKLDGSNIRAEWNPKKGFYKFGTRTQLIDESSPFGKAIKLIKDKYQDDLHPLFNCEKYESAICFFEYWGPNSFAGQHLDSDNQTVTLFDINPYKCGLLEPSEFIEKFGHLDIAKVLYEGYATSELFNQVKQSTLPDMPFEGVVCKGANDKKTKMPIMFKIKSKAWLDKLWDQCQGNENLFNRLL